jgi:hypothetical protein
MATPEDRIAAFALVQEAIKLQLSDDANELSEIEDRLVRALELDPSSIEALQEAAHFYDAVQSDASRARDYGFRCRERISAVVSEMDGILDQDSRTEADEEGEVVTAGNDRIVVLRRFPSEPEAELARSALEAYGIRAAIQRGPYSQPVDTMDLLVREEDVQAATDILGSEERR